MTREAGGEKQTLWGHEPGNRNGLCKIENAGNRFSPRASEGISLADTLTLAPRDSFWTSDIQNFKRINVGSCQLTKFVVTRCSSCKKLIQGVHIKGRTPPPVPMHSTLEKGIRKLLENEIQFMTRFW